MKMPPWRLPLAGLVLFAALAGPALAQNSSGVPGPSLEAGHRAIEYRIAHGFEEEGRGASTVQRLHYQETIGGDLRWRVTGQMRTVGGDTTFNYAQAELTWELTAPEARYKRALRFHARAGGAGRPHQLAVNLLQQFDFTPSLSGRFVVQVKERFGEDAQDGLVIDTRAALSYALPSGAVLWLESYNDHGTTAAFGRHDRQRQQIGPAVTLPLG